MLDLQQRLLALNSKAYDAFSDNLKNANAVISICTNLFEDEFGLEVEAWFASFNGTVVNSPLDGIVFFGATLEAVIIKLENHIENKLKVIILKIPISIDYELNGFGD